MCLSLKSPFYINIKLGEPSVYTFIISHYQICDALLDRQIIRWTNTIIDVKLGVDLKTPPMQIVRITSLI